MTDVSRKTAPKTKPRKRREWGKIQKQRSGRLQASYLGPDGLRYPGPITYSTVTDARAWLTGIRASIQAGTWRPPAEVEAERQRAAVPFSTFAADWVESRHNLQGEALRATTRNEYLRLLAGPLAPFGDRLIPAITEGIVMDWHNRQLRSGNRTQTARAYSLLRSVMDDARKRGLIPVNPCKIDGAGSTKTGKTVKPPTSEELATIVAAMPERYGTMALVAAWSGLRYGELTELRRKDVLVTRDHGTVVSIDLSVSRAVTHIPGQPAVVGAPKTAAGEGVVAMPAAIPGLYPAILRHLAEHVGAYPDALLFPSAGDPTKHLRQSSLAKVFMPARAKAGRPDLPWHALRHYAASQYAAAGATLTEVQARLRQASPGIAARYVHTTGREADLLARMGTATA